jgi:hypothetical protein
MADSNSTKKAPDFFVCIAEVTDADRKERRKSYPVRVAGAWERVKDGKTYIQFGRFKLNALITRNTQIVLFENTAQEEDESLPTEHDDGVPF